uniref:HNH endonuclease signature motif containing protein n=1 Tax=Massilia pseudoviolaceinigra TaxID=3057165 RepID=UPI0035B508B6
MGSRGPASKALGGYGTISAKGYRRIWCKKQQRYRMEHDVVWEKHNGPIPPGFDVHHRDEKKLHNAFENLELLSKLHHKREHSGCELRDGVWWKPCRKCGVVQCIDAYYKRVDGVSSRCKSCSVADAVEAKRKRRSIKPPNS